MAHAFLGTAGRLVPFACPSDVGIVASRPSSTRVSLGGRVSTQHGARMHRTWSIGLGLASPAEAASLAAAVHMGGFPWVFYEPSAVATNILTPSQSLLAPGTVQSSATEAGHRVASDGVMVARTWTVAAGATAYVGIREGAVHGAPIPQAPVTGSVYASNATLRMIFRDSAGSWISSAYSPAAAGFGRVHVTATPPPNAVDVLLQIVAGSEVAQVGYPALSLTDSLTPWGVGRGAVQVVTYGLDESVIAAHDRQQLSAYSFTVQEVGAGA